MNPFVHGKRALATPIGKRHSAVTRVVLALGCATMLLQSTGCASRIYLYDEARDKQAIAAKADSDAINSSSFVPEQQANLNALLAKELSTQDQLALAIRDQRIRSIAGSAMVSTPPKSPPAGLVELIDARLDDLLGPTWRGAGTGGHATALEDTMAQWAAWKQGQGNQANVLDGVSPLYDRFGMGVPSCDGVNPPSGAVKEALDKASDDDKAVIMANLRSVANACAHAAGVPRFTGQVDKAYKDLAAATTAESAAESAVAAPKKQYADALAAYNKAVANIASLGAPEAQKAVDAAAEDLKKAVATLDAINSAFSTQFIGQERLDSLQDFVTALTAGVDAGAVAAPAAAASDADAGAPAAPAAPASAGAAKDTKAKTPSNKGAAAVVLLANLVDGARKSFADAKTPLNLPLQITRDQLQLQVQAATVDVEAQKKVVALHEQLVTTMTDEVHELGLAKNELARVTPAVKSTPDVNMPRLQQQADYATALQVATLPEKKLLLSATRRYLDVVYWYDAQRYKLNYQLIAATYDRTLAYSAVSVKRWQSLVDASTGQVAEFYAGGIKPETLIAVLQAFGVVWIGHGVNK